MIAKKIIDEIHDKGGKVLSFKSYCGGFPAPESNNNPFGYKFSWSPRGVLLASKRSAIYKENGKKIVIPEGEIFGKDYISRLDIPTDSNIGSLEVYANSDSLKYSEIYNIPEAETIFRSTLRYPGWSETIKAIQKLNYLSLEEYTTNCTYSEYLAKLLKCENEDLKSIVAKKLEINLQHDIMERLEWLGIFSNAKNISKNQNMAPLDVLTELMINKMTYKEKEKDVLVLVNEFVAQNSDSSKQKITASLIEYGEFGKYTAMAKTVSYPASICTELLLANKIKAKGVVIPTDKEIYLPVLEELQTNLGLKIETVYKNLK
jgi:saccharopine dehydrogenase-like NADP-dependent oxidoreductase